MLIEINITVAALLTIAVIIFSVFKNAFLPDDTRKIPFGIFSLLVFGWSGIFSYLFFDSNLAFAISLLTGAAYHHSAQKISDWKNGIGSLPDQVFVPQSWIYENNNFPRRGNEPPEMV